MSEAINVHESCIELVKSEIKYTENSKKQALTKHIFQEKSKIANIYHLQGKNDEALSIKLETLEYFQKTNDLY